MKKYNYDDVLAASTEYFNGDDLAAKVFVDKYALQNQNGEYLELTPQDMHKRLAKEFARIESKYPNPMSEEEIFSLLDKFKYIVPQGSPMSAIGNQYQTQSLGNCFVVDSPYDSYGGILKTDQELTQLMKRRCVEENSLVCTKEKSIIPIKDVEIGMHILSFDAIKKTSAYNKVLNKFSTDVSVKDRVLVTFNNGTILKTSKKHPILLENDNGYFYKNVGDLKKGDVCIKHEPKPLLLDNDDIGWFIGAHLGDGSCDKRKQRIKNTNKTKNIKEYYEYDEFRFRIAGDNENIIKHYGMIFGKLTGKTTNYHLSYNKKYSVPVWKYASSSSYNEEIIVKYFDNQYGKKTYNCFVPAYIKDNNLWWSMIVGLIDTDGHLKEKGQRIDLSITSRNLINDISSFLSSNGVPLKVSSYTPKRKNEKNIYKLSIFYSKEIWEYLSKYLRHSIKKKILQKKIGKEFSKTYSLFENEVNKIIYSYNCLKYKNDKSFNERNLLSANIINIKKQHRVGKANLNTLVNNNLLSQFERQKILQRTEVLSIENDYNSKKYVDIEVENTNNFYCGDFGFVVIHNCGVGVDLSNLRPKDFPTNNAARTSDGIGVFMERYSNTTREVAQNGRRGALLESLHVQHPDVETFITIKNNNSKVTGANISLRITDDFMNAVKKNQEYTLKWPVNSTDPKVIKKIKAKNLWDKIINSAWTSAEPGLLFWDTLINNSIPDLYANKHPVFKTQSTNPCGELPLGLDSCRLMVINLLSFVKNPFTKNAEFDFEEFSQKTIKAQRLMDNTIDIELEMMDKIISKVENDPEPESIKQIELDMWKTYKKSCQEGRRTGLGITALGDMMAALNIKYGSKESVEITDKIYRSLAVGSHTSSCILAKERGSFPIFDYNLEKNHTYLNSIFDDCSKEIKQMWKTSGRRNIANTTTAPTGSVSMMTQTSSGIEPVYLLSYKRRKKINPSDKNARVDFVDELGDKWQEFNVYHQGVKRWMDATGETDIKKSPYWGATSNDIDWMASVDIQAVAQKSVDHSISKTCNLPSTVSKELVSQVYMRAWESGCKGFTVYRDGCRSGVLVKIDEENIKKDKSERPKQINLSLSPKRLEVLSCEINKVKINGEQWSIFVGMFKGMPYEIFGGLSKYIDIPNKYKTGNIIKKEKNLGSSVYNLEVGDGDDKMVIKDIANIFENPVYGAFSRTISLSLRHGVPVQYIVEQLQKDKHSDITSYSKVIARVLKTYIKDGTITTIEKICPNCSQKDGLIYQQGCISCTCGYSKC